MASYESKRNIEQGPPNVERIVLYIEGLQTGHGGGSISQAIRGIVAIRSYTIDVVLGKLEFDLDTNQLSITAAIKLLRRKTAYTFKEYMFINSRAIDLIFTKPISLDRAEQLKGIVGIEKLVENSCTLKTGAKRSTSISSIKTTSSSAASGSSLHTRDERNALILGLPFSEMLNSNRGAKKTTQLQEFPIRIHYDQSQIGPRALMYRFRKFCPGIRLAPPAILTGVTNASKELRQALILSLPTLALTVIIVIFASASSRHKSPMFEHVSFAIATLVQSFVLKTFIENILQAPHSFWLFEVDFLIVLSTMTAYISSVVSYAYWLKDVPLRTKFSFENFSLLVTFSLVGRLLNELWRSRFTAWASFQAHQPDQTLLVTSGSTTRKMDFRLLEYGDRFEVPPYTNLVTDGYVTQGGSEVEESLTTGESVPVAKGVGSFVCAGTNNRSGKIIVKLTALPHENSIQRIASMLEMVKLRKPLLQSISDRIMMWIVPVLATVSIAIFLVWMVVAYHRDRYHNWKDAFIEASTFSVSALAVSCPCAISLSASLIVLAARSVGARFGIIFRDSRRLCAQGITDVVFEKTGVLTRGLPTVIKEEYYGLHESKTKALLLSLLKDIEHPVFQSLLAHLEREVILISSKNIEPLKVVDITNVYGEGVRGTCIDSGHEICAGNPDWLKVCIEETAASTICVTIDKFLCAVFKLTDQPRQTAESVVSKCQAQGIKVHMISSDNQGAVDSIAHSLSIPRVHTRSCCRTGAKVQYIKSLQKSGNTVMYVGSGRNSSPLLKQANIGVELNRSLEWKAMQSTADVVLMTPRLHNLLILLKISRDAHHRMVFNFCWSIIYNISAILFAAGAFIPFTPGRQFRIPVPWAGLGGLVGVLPVVLVAFSMRWIRYGKPFRDIEYEYIKTVHAASWQRL